MIFFSKIELFLNEILNLWSDISFVSEIFDILLGIFGVIQNKISGILKNVSYVMEINDISRNYDFEVSFKG